MGQDLIAGLGNGIYREGNVREARPIGYTRDVSRRFRIGEDLQRRSSGPTPGSRRCMP